MSKNVLLDECMPEALAEHIRENKVTHARKVGLYDIDDKLVLKGAIEKSLM